MIKNNKGITMITLIITIVIISIISGVTIYESVQNVKARKIDLLYADLEQLEDKINVYYLKYGKLPIKEQFNGSENFKTVKNVNDNNVYYVIDISSLDGVSLNMKLDFTGDDVYIMNEQSHTVYYPKGLTIDNETYYTLPKQYSKIINNVIGNISFGEETWDRGNAKVPISTTSGYKIQYQINGQDGEWIDLQDGVVDAKWKDEIFVRLTDGENYGEVTSMVVEDKIISEINCANSSFQYDGTSKSINITVKDNESGISKISYEGNVINFDSQEEVYEYNFNARFTNVTWL